MATQPAHPHSGQKSASTSDIPGADLFERHKRTMGWVLIVALLGVGGTWFFLRSKALKQQHALEAYHNAMQSVLSGNVRLGESDLKKLTTRYVGTDPGTEGALALAKLYYQENKFKEGLAALEAAKPSESFTYDVKSLLGVGYEGTKEFEKSGKAYEDAAKAARFPSERDMARANAARAYEMGQKRDAALKIWQELAADPQSAAAAEARVRVGELTARAL